MKVLTITTLFVLLVSFMQKNRFPVKALYTYKQEIKKGVNDGKKTPAVYRYRIFLEKWNGQTVTVSRLWVDGKERLFETSVVTAPVLMEKTVKLMKNVKKDTLVAATANEVIELQVTQLKESGAPVPKRLREYELLVEYTSGNKTFYIGSKQLKLLSPQMRL